MILSQVRTTIRDRMIGLGYEEWTGFSDENVPETILDKTFHVSVSGGTGANLAMHVLRLPNDVKVTLWRKGFNNPVEAQDAALGSIQEMLCDLLNPATRSTPSYRRIDLSSYELEPIAGDNESVCKAIVNLTVETILEVTQTIEE